MEYSLRVNAWARLMVDVKNRCYTGKINEVRYGSAYAQSLGTGGVPTESESKHQGTHAPTLRFYNFFMQLSLH